LAERWDSGKTQDPTRDLARAGLEVERMLGRGVSSVVYAARQRPLDRSVAVKLLKLSPDGELPLDARRRFQTEARTLASFQHPHIVTLYDYGELPDGRCYLVMEHVSGRGLDDLLRDGPLPMRRAVDLMVQICKALRYAHDRGVIHRDIKPSNLFVRQEADGSDHLKVLDFGLVKLLDADQEATLAGELLGSPHCMSPEQISGSEIRPATDVYAVGAVLYRCLTGRFPFQGTTAISTMLGHLHHEVPPFAVAAPDLRTPAMLEAIVRRCLAKEPAHRYATIDELGRALAPYSSAGASTQAEEDPTEPDLAELGVTGSTRAARTASRSTWLLVAVIVIATALGLALSVLGKRVWDATTRADAPAAPGSPAQPPPAVTPPPPAG
jgi:serine/threonine-protein kinase